MNIHIALYAYGLVDELLRAYRTADQENVTWHLFLHSRVPAVVAACEQIAAHGNVVYYPYGTNRGCARAANEALVAARRAGADVFMSWPDDVYARPGDVQRIAETVLAHPECSIVESMGWVERTQRTERLSMNGGAINLKAVDTIGYFDENLSPVYFEDTDWLYRARLAGMDKVIAADTYLTHAGSKTLTMPELTETFSQIFSRNKAYYCAKWGGDGGYETFTHPFNDPTLSIKIERDMIGNPYAAHWIENALP